MTILEFGEPNPYTLEETIERLNNQTENIYTLEEVCELLGLNDDESLVDGKHSNRE
jgi:hypothetical protein